MYGLCRFDEESGFDDNSACAFGTGCAKLKVMPTIPWLIAYADVLANQRKHPNHPESVE